MVNITSVTQANSWFRNVLLANILALAVLVTVDMVQISAKAGVSVFSAHESNIFRKTVIIVTTASRLHKQSHVSKQESLAHHLGGRKSS